MIIRNDLLVSAFVYLVRGGNYHFNDPHIVIRKQSLDLKRGIVMEDNVWLSVSVNVIDRERISKGIIMGASPLVTQNIEKEDSPAINIPARVVRKRV